MEWKKDDALKCLRIAKEALEAGDRRRALKFIAKARHFDPTLPVDDLLNQNPDPKPPPPPAAAAAAVGGSSSSSTSANFTEEEQLTIVMQIMEKNDYYEILGLEKSCTEDDVKKAYRKLSLKVHPDKNKAPEAEEAFKAVSRAFQCLCDQESRKKYDLSTSEDPRSTGHCHYPQGFGRFYEAEIDPDEIFWNFYYGDPPTTQYRTYSYRTRMRQRRNGDDGLNRRKLRLIRWVPVILSVLVGIREARNRFRSSSWLSLGFQFCLWTAKKLLEEA